MLLAEEGKFLSFVRTGHVFVLLVPEETELQDFL